MKDESASVPISLGEPSVPTVEVTFSRPTYRLGSSVVGNIRVTDPEGKPNGQALRQTLQSLEIAMTGHCRLDARWHSRNKSISGSSHSSDQGSSDDISTQGPVGIWGDFPHADNNLCIWSSNRLDLLSLKERESGRWEDVSPKPIVLSGKRSDERVENRGTKLEDTQLAFSFRGDLPTSLPPTLVATSCRYYYTVVIRFETSSTSSPQWLQVPVEILTASPLFADRVNNRGKPVLRGLAHSGGLPCGVLTATELEQWGGRLTVHHRHSAAHSQHICHRRGHHHSQVQSMRVTDPKTGHPVCLLTVMGATLLHPGSRIVIKLDFPRTQEPNVKWVPAHQASACIEGEEVAIRLRDGKRTRARAYLLDTAHVGRIDPSCVESVSLSLLVPLSAPYTIETERVEVRIRCIIDICCSGIDDLAQKGKEDYRNLRLEIPCQVVHATGAWEEEKVEAGLDELSSHSFGGFHEDTEVQDYIPEDPRSFPANDIEDDLAILSLRLADTCNLRSKAPYFPDQPAEPKAEH